jgi:hypothetical protein
MSNLQNSWYLPIANHHHYLCRCAYRTTLSDPLFVTRRLTHFRCPECGCDTFLDALEFAHNTKLLYWSPFRWHYKGGVNGGAWEVRAVIDLPYFHFLTQEIRTRELPIASLALNPNGTIDQRTESEAILKRKIITPGGKNIREIKAEIEAELPLVLLQLFDQNPGRLCWLRNTPEFQRLPAKEKLRALQLFLRHSQLREFDFFHWKTLDDWKEELETNKTVKAMLLFLIGHRKAKSLRRALFNSYTQAISQRHYDPLPDYLFARLFGDPNYLASLLALPPLLKVRIFEGLSRTEGMALSEWLMANYTPKRLYRLFIAFAEINRPRYLFRDIYRMIQIPAFRRYLGENPQHLPADPGALHDLLANLRGRMEYTLGRKSVFEYSEADRQSQEMVGDLYFRLPLNTYELDRWSRELSNCMFGYRQQIHRGESIIYGVFRDEKLLYAVEIVGGRITQDLGRFNKVIPDEDGALVQEWFRQVWVKRRVGKGDEA